MVAKNTVTLDKELRATKKELKELRDIVREMLICSSKFGSIGITNANVILEKL